MKAAKIIVDTGPLVAFLNRRDRFHEWTLTQFATLPAPLLTCEAVLSEACFLLRHHHDGPAKVLQLVDRLLLSIPFQLEDEASAIGVLIRKYRDVPMSLADACLVRMTEQVTDSAILTLDGDFRIYRKNKSKIIPTLMPKGL